MMEPEPDECKLARRARDGDRAALAELIERTRLPLFALAYAELRHYEDAQDAVAAALVQICLHVGELREPARARGWMQSIVRNKAHLLARRRSALPTDSWETLGAKADVGSDDRCTLLRLDIERALRQLPRDEAHAIALFYLADLSVEEIARRTGRPEGTIKRWLHQGRRHLANEMKGYRPMTKSKRPTAAILGDALAPEFVQNMSKALRAAGFGQVAALKGLPPLERAGMGDHLEYHLPEPLKEARLIVLDEWVEGRSAFELYVLLRATVEGKRAGVCQLLSAPADATIFAAWAAGCEMCFTKESLEPADFERLARRWLTEPAPETP